MSQSTLPKAILSASVAAGAVGALAWFACRPDSQLLGRTLVAGQSPCEIALTYDDGPNDRSTLPLLEVLDRHGVRATFFMIGQFVRQRPELARQVHRAGHLIGNHTMTHPFLATRPLQLVEDELRRCNEALEDTLGAPVRYFRAPYGARRPAVLRCARELGLTPVQWNITAKDWEPIGSHGILRNVEKGIASLRLKSRGANILLHDGFNEQMGYDRSDTVRATDLLLTKARGSGTHFVTVDAWN